jgi:hypothetical protein
MTHVHIKQRIKEILAVGRLPERNLLGQISRFPGSEVRVLNALQMAAEVWNDALSPWKHLSSWSIQFR